MNISKHCLAGAVALLGLGLAAGALAQSAANDGYAVNAAGRVVKNAFGLCWRTYNWTVEKAIAECDPDLVRKPAPIAAPAPAPIVAPRPAVVVAPPVVARVIDSDGDGVPDDRDRCPGTPAGAPVNAQGCELDSDRDGVVDRFDKCMGTRSGAKVDYAGCEIVEVITLKGVHFATNSARLTPESAAILDEAAATLVKRGNVQTEVAGYTDDRGSDVHNRSLSQARAESVMRYLVGKGVNARNLSAKGYGEDNPVAENKTESGRAANRRVELRAQ